MFLPFNSLLDCYCIDKVYETKYTQIIVSVWDMNRVFDDLIGIGKDVGNEFRFDGEKYLFIKNNKPIDCS